MAKGRQIYFQAEEINEMATIAELCILGAESDLEAAKESLEWASTDDSKNGWTEQIQYYEDQIKRMKNLSKKLFYYGD